MNRMPQIFSLAVLFLSLAASAPAAETKGVVPDTKPADINADAAEPKTTEQSYVDQLKALLDEWTNKSKELGTKGMTVTAETKNWLKTDFQKIGDWQYKQVAIPHNDIATLESVLNKLGAERWECFFIQPDPRHLHVLLKRPAVSYLHKLSQVDFLRLLSSGGEAAGAAAE